MPIPPKLIMQPWLARHVMLRSVKRMASQSSAMKIFEHVGDALNANVERYPADLRIQSVKKPAGMQGSLNAYRSDASKDSRELEGVLPGLESNQMARFMSATLRRNWELYPLWACMCAWAFFFTGIVYGSFSKWEIWLDRSKKVSPFDWERDGGKYANHHATFWDNVHGENYLHVRNPLLEALQAELLDAAKAAGTR